MNDIERLVENYLGIWNETDARRRRELVTRVFTEDAEYIDPIGAVIGTAAIDGFIANVQGHYPGVQFRLAGRVDAHHDQARFTWHAGPAGASEPLAIGFDVVVVEGSRLRRVYGFLDKRPS